VREGIQWIRRRPALLLLLWLHGGTMIVYGGWPLLLIELARRQGASSGAIGLIFGCGGAGTILGALLTPLAQRRFGVGRLVIVIAWIFALTWPPYALASNLLVLGAVNCIGFFFVPVSFGTQLSYRLLLTPDALQGRVNSLFRLVIFGGQTLGFVLTGVLLQWRGPVATVWITFVPAVGLALAATLGAPLRRVGRLDPSVPAAKERLC
jgi:predicted MFS family arabinose efflux permease